MNSKLATLRKALALSNNLHESSEVIKLAALGSMLLGTAKVLGIGYASGKAHEYSTDYASKLANLPEAKAGFNYELYYRVTDPKYKGMIQSYSLYSVVGDLYKSDKKDKPNTKNIVDIIDSEKKLVTQSVYGVGEPAPYGFFFAPKFGIAQIFWKNGAVQNVMAEAKQTGEPAGTFVMYITDNSIAQTDQAISGLGDAQKSEDFKKEHGREISSEEGRRDLVEKGTSLGVDIGTTALLGGASGAVGIGSTLAAGGAAYTGGAAAVSGALGGGALAAGAGATAGAIGAAWTVAMPVVALYSAGKAGWEIGTAFDQWTGASNYIGPKINSWIESATSKDGISYELTLEAGRWKPFISKYNLEVVSGSLIKDKVKTADDVNDQFETKPVSPDQKSTAVGKDFGGASFLPINLVAKIYLNDGNSINVPASTITMGDPVKLTLTEADITTKISRLVSKGKFSQTEGMPLSPDDIKAATSVKSKESQVSKQIVSGQTPSTASGSPAKRSGGATTWDQYMAKTPNGQPVRDAWNKWATTLGYNPEDYPSFKALWKSFAKRAGTYNINVPETVTMLEALGRATAIDQKNPATKGTFASQAWDLISKFDLAGLGDVNEYNKSYVA